MQLENNIENMTSDLLKFHLGECIPVIEIGWNDPWLQKKEKKKMYIYKSDREKQYDRCRSIK